MRTSFLEAPGDCPQLCRQAAELGFCGIGGLNAAVREAIRTNHRRRSDRSQSGDGNQSGDGSQSGPRVGIGTYGFMGPWVHEPMFFFR